MANQFIVNLSTEDGLPLDEAVLAGWDDSAATWVANGTSLLDVTTVTGSGAGARASVVVSGGPLTPAYAVTILEGGDGYKVGDEVAILGDGVEFSDDLTLTLNAAALVTPDTEAQALVPVDYALFVQLTASDANSVEMRQIQPEHNRYWKFSLNGGTLDNADAILLSVNAVMRRAMQATHSDPVLELPDGVTCYDVALS